eukprot:TRINITY_DN10936_c0_g1_i1.p1 TRINITY_DN10936_c0_g1~~TRINITY_DN10936_c0_g1_i1.p1  ORF type:complete len:569 (+),score=116.51 TRINITY_DN10936_c0_g1_i1:41-1747(+)
MSKESVTLAKEIIKIHFGPTMAKVCQHLLNGRITYKLLVLKSGVTKDVVRECLLVGLQNNFIYYIEEFPVTWYVISIESVIKRLRYPLYLNVARRKFGSDAEILLSILITNGRMTNKQLVDEFLKTKPSQYMMYGRNIGEEQKKEASDLIGRILKHQFLISSKAHIEDCRLENSKTFTETHSRISEKFTMSRRSSKLNKDTKKSSKKRIHPSVVSKKGKKRRVVAEKNAPSFPDFDPLEERRRMERDQMAVENGEAVNNPVEDEQNEEIVLDDVNLWCINPKKFDAERVKEECIDLCRVRFKDLGGKIVEKMFEIAEGRGISSNTSESNFSMNEIVSAILEEDHHIQVEEIADYLELMAKDTASNYIHRYSNEKFNINVDNMMIALKQSIINSIISEKYDPVCTRIFNLLRDKPHLDVTQIAKYAIIDTKEAKKQVYKMWEGNILQTQEIPRTSDYAPGNTFYMWRVNPDAEIVFQNMCCQIMANVLKRMDFIVTTNQDLIKRGEMSKTLDSDARAEYSVNLSHMEQQRLDDLEEMRIRMLSIVHKLDDTLFALSFAPKMSLRSSLEE